MVSSTRWSGHSASSPWKSRHRAGVRPGSFLHRTEVFGPVLALMEAADLDEALEWQNSVGYGLTGGLHSLDDDEIDHWLEHVEVGNTYVDRHITGAIVQRQSFGGWKASLFGDNHMYGPEGITFYTRGKVVTERWPDPSTSTVDLGFPRTR